MNLVWVSLVFKVYINYVYFTDLVLRKKIIKFNLKSIIIIFYCGYVPSALNRLKNQKGFGFRSCSCCNGIDLFWQSFSAPWTLNLSNRDILFQWSNCVTKVRQTQFHHLYFEWHFLFVFLYDWLVGPKYVLQGW